jgi:hypothetical protein
MKRENNGRFFRRREAPTAFVLLALTGGVMRAVGQPSLVGPSSPGTPCSLALPGTTGSWAEQEHWVWKEVCEGRVADLQKYRLEHVAVGDPQLLSSRFLQTILFFEPFRTAVPEPGIHVRGAHFKENLDLSHRTYAHDLGLKASSFEGFLDLTGSHFSGELSLEGSHFGSLLLMQGTRIDRDLVMTRAEFSGNPMGEVRLAAASIGGSLNLEDAVVSGQRTLNMDSLLVERDLFLNGTGGHHTQYWRVWLQNARVGGIVSLDDAEIRERVIMNGFEVGSNLSMLNSSFTDVTMTNLKAKGDVKIEGPRELTSQDRRHSLDLSGATIGGELILGSASYGPLRWPSGASLNLRNTAVFAVEDGIECSSQDAQCSGSWPSALELDGFTYQQLGGNENESNADMAARSSRWWVNWLNRERHLSPQPYEQLASVLGRLGYKDKATDVLYEEKNHERVLTPYPERMWMTLQWLLIGYGYRTSRSLWWIAAFICAGAAVLRLSGEGQRLGMPFGFAYSVDMLLPIIRLREAHYSMDLKGWARYYFYVHKMTGYVLASFLIAGLSGLTK